MTVHEAQVDRRGLRREAKRATILAEAWALAHRDGLAAISLRDLAERVDLRQPSLYAYFDSKLGLYDLMFADGNRQLLELVEVLARERRPPPALVEFVEALVRFSTEDVVRHQLLFQRTIPGFEPSARPMSSPSSSTTWPASGSPPPARPIRADVDVFCALASGLAHQQVANDPGGDRWVRLAERAVEMFLADVDRRRQRSARKGARDDPGNHAGRDTIPRIAHDEAMRIAAVENAKFAGLLRSFEPDDWTKPTDCALWDVRALAAHVVGSAAGQASPREFVRQVRKGRPLVAEMAARSGGTG